MAIFSLSCSGAMLLQSLPRTIGAWRTTVNGCGFSSTIQHHSALHSSHLLRSSPSRYASFLPTLEIQAIPPASGSPLSTRGMK